MNIIIDCTTTQDQLKNSGIGNYTKNVVAEMSKQAQDRKDVRSLYLLLFDGKSTLDRYKLDQYDKVKIVRCGKPRLSNYLNQYWYHRQILPQIKDIISGGEAEFKYFCPYFWRYYPAKLLPTILTAHDMGLAKFNIYAGKGGWMNFIRKKQYWHALAHIDKCEAILTNSFFTKQELISYFPFLRPEKIVVSYLGIEKDIEELSDDPSIVDKYLPEGWNKRGYFINMGSSVSKNKNTHGLIESYSLFVKKCGVEKPPFLVIAGKDFLNESAGAITIHEQVTKLGLDDKVIFTGFYEDGDRVSLLRNSLSFIHLSLYEGFGIAVADAMASGALVMAHKGSSYEEVVGVEECLVDGTDYEGVADRMLTIWDKRKDTAWREAIILKTKERAKRYDWQKCAKKSLDTILAA